MVNDNFFDVFNYSICKAFSKKVGNQKTNLSFRYSGKLFYEELFKQKIIKKYDSDFENIKEIAKFLEKVGYLKKIKVSNRGKQIKIRMEKIILAPSSKRLIKEKCTPSHLMTYLMFAALNKKIEVVSVKFGKNFVEEVWKI
jgi:hypothetical protein